MELRNLNSGCQSFATLRDDDVLHSVCWGLSHWRRHYERFGIVPGICIDCKSEAVDYSLNLVTVNTRTNAGNECVLFMGFLADERERTFVWFLRRFKEFCGIDPSMIAMDQQAACIAACRVVLPTTYLTLDDWYLNQNQIKNVRAYICKIQKKEWNEQMHDALFRMRRSTTSQSFLDRRSHFEATYFTEYCSELPDWFKFVYHTYAHITIDCYNKTVCDPRFLFQGSGYTESSNAMFRRIIMQRKVRISEVPLEMRRLTVKRWKVKEEEAKQEYSGMIDKLAGAQLGMMPSVLRGFVMTYTKYALRNFYNKCVKSAANYILTEVEFVPGCANIPENLQPPTLKQQRSTGTPTSLHAPPRSPSPSSNTHTLGNPYPNNPNSVNPNCVIPCPSSTPADTRRWSGARFKLRWTGVAHEPNPVHYASRRRRGRAGRMSRSSRGGSRRGRGAHLLNSEGQMRKVTNTEIRI